MVAREVSGIARFERFAPLVFLIGDIGSSVSLVNDGVSFKNVGLGLVVGS